LTVTDTGAEVVALPLVSVAVAVTECEPFATDVESHGTEYGDVVSGAPTAVPSTLSCTLATPTLSEADALNVTDPDTVAPAAGAVTDTVGGVVSGGAPPPEGTKPTSTK
jgi:hypothetical protein